MKTEGEPQNKILNIRSYTKNRYLMNFTGKDENSFSFYWNSLVFLCLPMVKIIQKLSRDQFKTSHNLEGLGHLLMRNQSQ